MADPVGDGTLQLPAMLDAAAVARVFRAQVRARSLPSVLDFSAVRELDSSAVALVRALAALAAERGNDAPRLVGTPQRYAALCRAHREPAPDERVPHAVDSPDRDTRSRIS